MPRGVIKVMNEAQRNAEIKANGFNLLSLQQKGLSYFSIFDMRSKQAFLSAHLQGSFHAKDEKEIIESLDQLVRGGGVIIPLSNLSSSSALALKSLKP
ncbi:MAG: hypothetical protein HDT11_01420 [Helicobacter sp.]|nr:hypothetical protein [Helicobacter sp.]